MNFIEKWKYKLLGRTVPVFRVIDAENGKVTSFEFGKWVRRGNSLLKTWDVTGAEIRKDGLLLYTDESGITQPCYAEYKGMTVPLYVEPREAPNHEKTIGGGATCDDLAEVLDLGKSMRNIIIGGLLSAPVWWFVFQLIGAMAK